MICADWSCAMSDYINCFIEVNVEFAGYQIKYFGFMLTFFIIIRYMLTFSTYVIIVIYTYCGLVFTLWYS